MVVFPMPASPSMTSAHASHRHEVEELHGRSELAFAANDRACTTDRLGHTASPLDTQILRRALRV